MQQANPKFRIKNGRIKQSIMGWTFDPMPTPELAKLCKEIGFGGNGRNFPQTLSNDQGSRFGHFIAGSHGFKKGPVDPANHDECVEKLTEAIELCADAGYKRGKLSRA